MADIIAWFVAHWDILVDILVGLGVLASLITALTSTPKDDEVVRKILAFLSFLQPSTSVGTVKAPLTRPAPRADEPLIYADGGDDPDPFQSAR